jgi:tRNA pseudouridine55 synthase
VLPVDKPAGLTSHDVVARVRRALGRRVKVGHAGTLDPFATGELLVLVGRATRVQRWLMGLPKRYEVVARFGAVSSTGDPEGEIVETGIVPEGDLELPVGLVRQRPPAYSAIKVAGRRAYALARAGEEVDLPEREVTVHRFEELWRDGDRRAFAIECSSGTYVRSLIADLGDAYCVSLRRTRIGSFDVGAALDLASAVDGAASGAGLIPLTDALAFLPSVVVSGETARRAAHGVAFEVPAGTDGVSPSATVRVLDADGLVCLAQAPPAADGPAAGGVQMLGPVVGFRG